MDLQMVGFRLLFADHQGRHPMHSMLYLLGFQTNLDFSPHPLQFFMSIDQTPDSSNGLLKWTAQTSNKAYEHAQCTTHQSESHMPMHNNQFISLGRTLCLSFFLTFIACDTMTTCTWQHQTHRQRKQLTLRCCCDLNTLPQKTTMARLSKSWYFFIAEALCCHAPAGTSSLRGYSG